MKYKSALYILTGVIISFTVGYLLPRPLISAIDGKAVFDHSDCQYPTRLSNPVDGCDNTDPACPIQKDGTELCPIETPQIIEPVVEDNIKDTVSVCK